MNDSANSFTLYQVNTTDGSRTSIGVMNNVNGTGTIFSAPGDGTIYLADLQSLYTVNPLNAETTEIGPLGFAVGAGALVGSFGGGLETDRSLPPTVYSTASQARKCTTSV